MIGKRLESFYAFTERFLGTARGWHGERPWRVDVRQAGGVDVGILQLNSAWTSGPDDQAGLLVGEPAVGRPMSVPTAMTPRWDARCRCQRRRPRGGTPDVGANELSSSQLAAS